MEEQPFIEAARWPLEVALDVPLSEAVKIILRCATRLCHGNQWLAEDITQDVLEHLNRLATNGSLGPIKHLTSYLNATTLHRFLDIHARLHKMVTSSLEEEPEPWDDSPGPERLLVEAETYEILRRGIAGLKPDQRIVMEALFYEGMSLSEIATEVGVPKSTVQGRQKAGITALRVYLARQKWERKS